MLVAGVLASAAIPSSPDDGGAVVRWSFGAQQLGCQEAGVQTVHVFVGPLAPSGSYDHEVECKAGEAGLRLEGVSAGPHVLVLKGLARDQVLFELTKQIDVPSEDEVDLGSFNLDEYTPP
jgi:hypothetical protein